MDMSLIILENIYHLPAKTSTPFKISKPTMVNVKYTSLIFQADVVNEWLFSKVQMFIFKHPSN